MKFSYKTLLVSIVIGFYVIHYGIWLFLGEKSFIGIFDRMDSVIIYAYQLLHHDNAIPLSVSDLEQRIPEAMNGIPRCFYRGGLNSFFLFAWLFPLPYSYILHHLLLHLIILIGTFAFFRRYITQSFELALMVAFIFSLMDFFLVENGLGAGGYALLFFSWLNFIYQKEKWYDYLILLLFPFFTFGLGYLPTFLLYWSSIGIYFWLFKKHRIPAKFLLISFIFFLIAFLIDYPLLYNLLSRKFTSHRITFTDSSLKPSLNHFLIGTILPFFGYFPTTLLLVVFIFLTFKKKILSFIKRNFMTIFSIFALYSTGIYLLPFLVNILKSIIPILKNATFYRVLGGFPLLWAILFLRSLTFIKQRSIVIILLILQGYLVLIFNRQWVINVNLLLYRWGVETIFPQALSNLTLVTHLAPFDPIRFAQRYPTFEQQLDSKLFNALRAIVGIPSDTNRIAFIGYYPNEAHYFGLYTIDAYQNNYPLEYKYRFRPIIAKELEKFPPLQRYFDYFGSRCYVFSSEIERIRYLRQKQKQCSDYHCLLKKGHTITIKPELDTKQMYRLGCRYLVSTAPLLNYNELQLQPIDTLEHAKSFWQFYVYKLLKTKDENIAS